MYNQIKRILQSDDGGTLLVMGPYLMVSMFLFLVIFINSMVFATKRNQLQIMADSASRAGTLAVAKSYAVRERTGHGYGDYHVYVELDGEKARSLAAKVLDAYEPILHGVTVTRIEVNPTDHYTFPVWNSHKFQYDEKPLSYEKQYKNGNFSLKVAAKLEAATKGFFGGAMDVADVEVYSQSTAIGRLIQIH